MGFLRPTSGTAAVDGLDCYRQSVEVRERTSYLPGDARLFDGMTGADVLAFFSAVRPGGNLERAITLAKRLDLNYDATVDFMSTGMRQKLALAAVLAAETPLVILDEPTANLDPNVRSMVLALVAEAKAEGRTVIFSSHVLSEVEEACDRVVILRQGRLVHTQAMSQLRRQHRIRALLGGPLPSPPPHLAGHVTVVRSTASHVVLETADELSPLLGWLATLPLKEVQIEPVGLRAVYDRFHSEPHDQPLPAVSIS